MHKWETEDLRSMKSPSKGKMSKSWAQKMINGCYGVKQMKLWKRRFEANAIKFKWNLELEIRQQHKS